MIEFDPHRRIDLTGPWVGFCFQTGRVLTLEAHQLEPGDLLFRTPGCRQKITTVGCGNLRQCKRNSLSLFS